MACMFNRNLFICVEQEGEGWGWGGGWREKAERKKKYNNIKMDGALVMQMKDNIMYQAKA